MILPIKKQWFDMIVKGVKREEYRAIKPYYTERFKNRFLLDKEGKPTGASDVICLRNGYSSRSPMLIANVHLRIGTGNPEWGAKAGNKYYVLDIDELLAVCM